MSWSQEQSIDLIFKLEQKIQPEKWQLDGVQLWPLIRVKFVIFLRDNLEVNDSDKTKKNKKINKYAIVKKVIPALKEWYRFSRMNTSDVMFVGAGAHRATFKEISYNKFFDPFRTLPQFKNSPLIEYSDITPNSFNAANTFSFILLYYTSRLKLIRKKDDTNILFWMELEKELKSFLITQNVNIEGIDIFIKSINKSWTNIKKMKLAWLRVLDKVKPSKILTLCYYNDKVYALNLAASERNITTFEVQHGPMSATIAYGKFEGLPGIVTQSVLLPCRFLVWNDSTKQHMRESFPQKETDIIGLTWFDFIGNNIPPNTNNKKIILYAMQPGHDPFPNYLIRWIKESSKEYTWFLRLHPRQMDEYELIKYRTSILLPGISVEIDKATSDPLPVVLNKSDIIITMISGVIIEAALISKPVVALDPYAHEYYKDEYEAKALYICSDADKELSWKNLFQVVNKYFKISEIKRVDSFEKFKELNN